MANEFVNTIRVSGPAEDRERVKAAIENSVIECGEGVVCLREYVLDWEKWRAAFPEWGDVTDLGTLESCYSYEHWNHDGVHPLHLKKDDLRPVRTVKDVLILQAVTRWKPPIAFVERLGRVFPMCAIDGTSLETMDSDLIRWRSRAGETELLERRASIALHEETYRWERQGKTWEWTGEREADVEMMFAFLTLECATHPDVLRTACRLAYHALAFPETTLASRANNYAYDLAITIAEYRHALILEGVLPAPRTPGEPESGDGSSVT
jgi:hypothetical protein